MSQRANTSDHMVTPPIRSPSTNRSRTPVASRCAQVGDRALPRHPWGGWSDPGPARCSVGTAALDHAKSRVLSLSRAEGNVRTRAVENGAGRVVAAPVHGGVAGMTGMPLETEVRPAAGRPDVVDEVHLERPEVEPVDRRGIDDLQIDGGGGELPLQVPAQVERRRPVGGRRISRGPRTQSHSEEALPPGSNSQGPACTRRRTATTGTSSSSGVLLRVMAMPTDIAIIDTMIGFPSHDRRRGLQVPGSRRCMTTRA